MPFTGPAALCAGAGTTVPVAGAGGGFSILLRDNLHFDRAFLTPSVALSGWDSPPDCEERLELADWLGVTTGKKPVPEEVAEDIETCGLDADGGT